MAALDKIQLLQRSAFLKGMPKKVLASLAERARVEEHNAGNVVVEKGATDSTMYFVVSGSVRVHDDALLLGYLGEGEVFGEISALDARERTASVTIESDSVLLAVDRQVLYESLACEPEGFFCIIRSVCRRERNFVESLTDRTQQILAYERELEIGRKIQAGFLPDKLPEIPGWSIAAYFQAAREVAGDFYDVFPLQNGRYLALVIGDVCDKGVGAALFMTLFRTLIRASCLHGCMGAPDAPPAAQQPENLLQSSVQTTNRYIAVTHGKSSMFASMFFGLLDTTSGKLFYINGGHEPPVVYRADGNRETLPQTGSVLGLFAGARFEVAESHLDPDDLLFAYTDGVTEAKNEAQDLFSEEQLLAVTEPDISDPTRFLERVLDRIRVFRGQAPQFDDITMLAIRHRATTPGLGETTP